MMRGAECAYRKEYGPTQNWMIRMVDILYFETHQGFHFEKKERFHFEFEEHRIRAKSGRDLEPKLPSQISNQNILGWNLKFQKRAEKMQFPKFGMPETVWFAIYRTQHFISQIIIQNTTFHFLYSSHFPSVSQ